ncbi:MAG TPA: LysR family transcriptional regulator [Oxalobacteraceae bacterium]|nr:LysR family transcriptional regulator [Oxalobacteraceae bacterium]
MELRHLRYFVVVAEEQHFTRAAERLGMQQPPLSQQIRALETELGFDLFRRHPKGADLTAGGTVFLKEARAILAGVETAARRAAQAADGSEGMISVGVTSSSVAHPVFPDILRAYRERYPNVTLNLNEGNAAELTDAIETGKIDAIFLRQPVRKPPRLLFHQLLEEEMLLVLPARHRLLTKRASKAMPTIALSVLADEDFILVRKHGAQGMYSNLVLACEQVGFTPRIVHEIDRMLTNISLVAAGAGISAVPASMREFHKERVAYCRIRGPRALLVAPINLVHRIDETAPAVVNFLALAKQVSKQPR